MLQCFPPGLEHSEAAAGKVQRSLQEQGAVLQGVPRGLQCVSVHCVSVHCVSVHCVSVHCVSVHCVHTHDCTHSAQCTHGAQ